MWNLKFISYLFALLSSEPPVTLHQRCHGRGNTGTTNKALRNNCMVQSDTGKVSGKQGWMLIKGAVSLKADNTQWSYLINGGGMQNGD